MSESGKKPARPHDGRDETREDGDERKAASASRRARRIEETDRVWSGTAQTTSDPNIEPWLVEELRRIYDDVLYEPIPQDMLDILRRAGGAEESHEDAEGRRQRLARERAIADFERFGGGDDGSRH